MSKTIIPESSQNILGDLYKAGIFSVVKEGDVFVFTDGCDDWFEAVLTKFQLQALANELMILSERDDS